MNETLFSKLTHRVTTLRRSATQNRKDASNIIFAIARGSAWKNVRSVDADSIELNKPYIVRRVFKAPDEPKRNDEPVAALWTERLVRFFRNA